MPRRFPPLRPKRPANDNIPEPLRTPIVAPDSPSNFAPEIVCSPSVFVRREKEEQPLYLADVATQTVPIPTATVVDAPRSANTEIVGSEMEDYGSTAWPSEIYNQSSTMWLLPPHSNQSSAIATLLQAEIQSHNITRDMLHATEQRRLEAIQRNNQLATDARGWATAYNNLTVALGRCAEEYSRVTADNVTLRTQMQALKKPKDDQVHSLQMSMSQESSRTGLAAPAMSFNTYDEDYVTPGMACYELPYESDGSECPYSPEV